MVVLSTLITVVDPYHTMFPPPTGRVVDGHSNEKINFSFQNQISSFNKGYLNPVIVMEPPPPFPVGSKLSFPNAYTCTAVLYGVQEC